MNIFVLDTDPTIAAMMLCDQHVVKMTLETAQLLCSAHDKAPYKRTHYSHPCAVWTRASTANYLWLCSYGIAVAEEYTHRFNKRHASEVVIRWAAANLPVLLCAELTPFAQAMPQQYRGDCAVAAYRRYYAAEKLTLRGKSTWRGRPRPVWAS